MKQWGREMNVTFFIGNGFDRNLGLQTTYDDFVKVYKDLDTDDPIIKRFRQEIHDHQDLWSYAERELGRVTSKFQIGEGQAFSECQIDFCEHLAEYLKAQEERIDFNAAEKEILKAFSRLNSISRSFPEQEQSAINGVYTSHAHEDISFRFICFNYTRTLDKCVEIVKRHAGHLGGHTAKNGQRTHQLGNICHVHGTIEEYMVFGVNDESQIANESLFECEYGEIFKQMLIKIQANASYQENTDAKAESLLRESSVIYVYGMSIGETDKLWWQRICKWLSQNGERHLIVQKHAFSNKSVLPIKYFIAERQAKASITAYSDLEEDVKKSIEGRIHITGDNIFGAMSNLVDTYQRIPETV